MNREKARVRLTFLQHFSSVVSTRSLGFDEPSFCIGSRLRTPKNASEIRDPRQHTLPVEISTSLLSKVYVHLMSKLFSHLMHGI